MKIYNYFRVRWHSGYSFVGDAPNKINLFLEDLIFHHTPECSSLYLGVFNDESQSLAGCILKLTTYIEAPNRNAIYSHAFVIEQAQEFLKSHRLEELGKVFVATYGDQIEQKIRDLSNELGWIEKSDEGRKILEKLYINSEHFTTHINFTDEIKIEVIKLTEDFNDSSQGTEISMVHSQSNQIVDNSTENSKNDMLEFLSLMSLLPKSQFLSSTFVFFTILLLACIIFFIFSGFFQNSTQSTVQKLNAEIAGLNNQNNALKDQNTALEQDNTKLKNENLDLKNQSKKIKFELINLKSVTFGDLGLGGSLVQGKIDLGNDLNNLQLVRVCAQPTLPDDYTKLRCLFLQNNDSDFKLYLTEGQYFFFVQAIPASSRISDIKVSDIRTFYAFDDSSDSEDTSNTPRQIDVKKNGKIDDVNIDLSFECPTESDAYKPEYCLTKPNLNYFNPEKALEKLDSDLDP
jgi:outer membrane murein-binding lipoprotein Lpp